MGPYMDRMVFYGPLYDRLGSHVDFYLDRWALVLTYWLGSYVDRENFCLYMWALIWTYGPSLEDEPFCGQCGPLRGQCRSLCGQGGPLSVHMVPYLDLWATMWKMGLHMDRVCPYMDRIWMDFYV